MNSSSAEAKHSDRAKGGFLLGGEAAGFSFFLLGFHGFFCLVG